MTNDQLEKIKQFALSYYKKTDQFHDARHAILTTKYALVLAKDYKETNLFELEAICYLHDIGRINVDEGHAKESVRLARPFLEELRLPSQEIEGILHAIEVHSIKNIHKAKTIEAKLLFDSDKIQQLSVYGFLKHTFFYIAEKKIDMIEAVDKMHMHVYEVFPLIQTPKAKEFLAPEIKKIEQLVIDFKKGLNGKLGK